MRIILIGCGKDKALPRPPNGPPWPKGYVKEGQPLHPRMSAKDLYVSTLFRKRRAFAEREVAAGRADQWAILSALHGCLLPEQEIGWYDRTVKGLRQDELDGWASRVSRGLWSVRRLLCEDLGAGGTAAKCDRKPFESYEQPGYCKCSGCLNGVILEIHAGIDYVDPIRPLLEAGGAIVETPVAGLQIGELLSWYTRVERGARQMELV